jgi:hypothetical protein
MLFQHIRSCQIHLRRYIAPVCPIPYLKAVTDMRRFETIKQNSSPGFINKQYLNNSVETVRWKGSFHPVIR